jgi:hypothetical protein
MRSNSILVVLKALHDSDINLNLSYMQVKVLAEGLLALANQASIKELLETPYDHILGGITIRLDLFLPTLRVVVKSLDRGISEPTVTELITGT